MGIGMEGAPGTVVYDKVPLNEVEVRRGEHVHATDGDIGRVQGLVIDPSDHHVTHVLLQEGHLWGRKDRPLAAAGNPIGRGRPAGPGPPGPPGRSGTERDQPACR
jgi:hypothetical protein